MANALTKKGPGGVPVWVIGIAAVVVAYIGYRAYENYRANSAARAASTANTTQPTDTGGLAAPTLGGTPQSTDSGVSGQGSGGGPVGPDQETQDLLGLLQQQQAYSQQAFGSQEDLIAALASGAQQTAQAADAALGSVAASSVEGLVTMATQTPSNAAPSTSFVTPTPYVPPAAHANGIAPGGPGAAGAPVFTPAQTAAIERQGAAQLAGAINYQNRTPTPVRPAPAPASGAGAVRAGAAPVNYQARARAR